jgi:maltose alpha-D-glucosyltransferase/alpha-amylase
VPEDDRSFVPWLDAFLLQKALYELEYELASRPAWASIPLLGVLQMLKER